MFDKIAYRLKSGKNNKLLYYIKNYIGMAVPKALFGCRLKSRMASLNGRSDKEYILDRVNYYNKLAEGTKLPADAPTLAEHRIVRQKVYFFDSYKYTRWFPGALRWKFLSGDVNFVPDAPTVVKSRPVCEGNENGVLLNLNKIRHFIFVNDKKSFREKKDMAVFRGKMKGKPQRIDFMNKWFGHPLCDLGDISRDNEGHEQWRTEKITIAQHLDYKFIFAIEGNDVASNLKWVMSSNSVAVMPRPTCETWFMEGRLLPNVHYIEVKADFSDVETVINHYIAHPEEAERIVENAHEYVRQFMNPAREELISLLVLDKYFKNTGQA